MDRAATNIYKLGGGFYKPALPRHLVGPAGCR